MRVSAKLAGVGLAASLLLTACAPVVGTVIEKEYEDGEWERYSCSKTTTVNGKSKTVTDTCRRWDDEDWELSVRTDEGKMREVEVSRPVFDQIQVGDTYDSEKH